MVKTTAESSSKMLPTPSSMLADALGVFGKAANHAIATAEKQAVAEVTRANAEAEEARRERDEAIDALNAIRLEKKEWQRRVDGWKTSVDKSDMTIEHQNETIAQLREEASQWKGQLLRYEDTSRREAQDWKEQYLRAEQERIRLAARVDELVTDQLAWNAHTNAQNPLYAARTQHTDLPNGTTPKRASTAALPAHQRPGGSRSVPPVFDEYEDQPPVPRKTKAASTKPTSSRGDAAPQTAGPSRLPRQKTSDGRPDDTQATRPSAAPRTLSKPFQEPLRVIRRVQAVIEVPVKEESDEDVEDLLSGADSEYDLRMHGKGLSGKTPQKSKVKRRSSVKSRRTIPSDDDDYEEPPVRRRTQADTDSEDELAIGAEDNRELYSARRVIVTSEKNTPQRQRATASASRPSTNTKKRKLDGDTTATSRGTTLKVARK